MQVDAPSADLARRALVANQSPRFKRIDLLDRYVETTQYEGKASYWDDSKPLFDRAPAVVYPIVQSAIRSHTSMVLGDSRFPTITSGQDEDDSQFDDEYGLSEDESAVLDRLLVCIGKQTRWRVVFRQMLASAMGGKTSCVVARVLNGKLGLDVVPAKWCTPTFKDDNADAEVIKLEIRYGYTKEEKHEATGQIETKAYLYRRVIDAQSDTTFKPVEADEAGAEPRAWQVSQKVTHNLGFCPVRWYRYMRGVSIAGDIDGHAIHEELLDEITSHDYSVSQRVRAVLYTTDPILLEIGVEKGYNPSEEGERRSIMLPGDPESMAQWQRPAQAGRSGVGRKRGPGVAYQYDRPDTKVTFLTLPAGAMEAATSNAAELHEKIAQALCWLPIDAKEMMGRHEMSGRALEWVHKRQIDYDNEVRTDFGDHGILPVVDLVLRIVKALGSTGGVYLQGLKQALPILDKFMRDRELPVGADGQKAGTEQAWMPPEFRLKWPPFFPDTSVDEKADGDNVRADLAANLITPKTALARRGKYYDIQDANKYADDMEAERKKSQADELAQQHDAAMALQQAAGMRRGGGGMVQPGQPSAKQAPQATPAPAAQRSAPARAKVKPPTSRLGAGRLTARRQPQKEAA